MKKTFQLILVLFLVLITFLMYQKYFVKKQDIAYKKEINNQSEPQSKNNLNTITNLKYEINIDKDNWFKIISKQSNLNPNGDVEMDSVEGTILSNSNSLIVINSNKAIFNKNNYNTVFKEKVIIYYENYKILAEKLKLNYDDKLIEISNNVFFYGPDITIKSDNILINLLNKKIDIYNQDNLEEVEINLTNVKY